MNQLQLRQSNQTPTASFELMLQQAQVLVKTGFLPQSIKTPEQAVAIIMTGQELGIGTMQALRSIDVIQGKPTVSPQLMLALINQSGQLENISIDQDDDGVMCTMKRKGRSAHSEYFGFVEAKKLGLDGKDNYRKQPFTMFRWRAVASCARVTFPDVILGLYTPDEMGAEMTDDGDLAGVETKIVPFEPQTTVRMPETKQLPAAEEKPDYSAEWEEALSGDKSPVSAETVGRLLAEGGFVSRSAKGYVVKENFLGELTSFDITKTNNIVECTCDDYADQSRYVDNYFCAHKWAMKFYAASQQKQAA